MALNKLSKIFVPARSSSAQYEIKKSKFIAHISPVATKDDALFFINKIKEEYKDARHNVPCYIIGEDFNEKWFSDDGEPGGSSGLPIISMLLKMKVTDIAVCVTRYFGGIKLGVGGLARAYPKAVRLALDEAGLKPFVRYEIKTLVLSYKEFETYKRTLEEIGGEILEENFSDGVVVTVKVPV